MSSSVAALVPHFHCEEWLPDCLTSLVSQTRPLDAIFVIDDGTGEPPVEIVNLFPQVTLLESRENVGPYRLVQQVMNDTGYDAYLFQDADDWSRSDRLELLLREAEHTGAELIGTQEIRIDCDVADAWTFNYPLDVNEELERRPWHYGLLHPTSLVSHDLVSRTGGYATGLRFSGDSDFLLRAVHVARVRNIPQHCYFRRKRSGSLTTDPSTALNSPARLSLREALHQRARDNAAIRKNGGIPNLMPYSIAPPVRLRHVSGPTHPRDPEIWRMTYDNSAECNGFGYQGLGSSGAAEF
jgi:glycosyltransferase involved in cell wall biosynthesis